MSSHQRKRQALVELNPNLVDDVNISDSKRIKKAESERETDNSQDQPSISQSRKRRLSEQDQNNRIVGEIATKRSKNDKKELDSNGEPSPEDGEFQEDFYVFEECGNLQRLPDPVVQTILGFLDRTSQMQFSLTCKRFSRVFNENLNNFEFTFDFDATEIPQTQRAYSNVVFKNLSKPPTNVRLNQIRSTFNSMGLHLKKVTFHLCTISDFMIVSALRQCPNITSLTFSKSNIYRSTRERDLHLPKLKELIVVHCTLSKITRIVQRIYSLEKIVLGCCNHFVMSLADPGIADGVEHIKEIISRQINLTELHITDGIFFDSPFNVQVNKLVLKVRLTFDQSFFMLDFINSQTKLVDLHFDLFMVDSYENVEQSLSHVLQLTTLKRLEVIFYGNSSLCEHFVEHGVINPNVVDLSLNICRMDHIYNRFIESTAKMFPNLTSLHIEFSLEWNDEENTSSRTLNPLNALKKLKTLILEGVSTRIITRLKLQNLKNFQMLLMIDSCQSEFESFINNNPLIEDLIITSLDGLDEHEAIHLIESAMLQLRAIVGIRMCLRSRGMSDESFFYLVHFGKQKASPTLKQLKVCSDVHNF